MRARPNGRRLWLLLTLALLPLSRPQPARAFDTGPHHDMTRSAMQDEGFAPQSPVIQIAQVSNWLVDYYSVSPFSDAQARRLLAHLHFDSLTSTSQIQNVWSRLTQNTQKAMSAAAADVRAARNPAERYRRMVYLAVLIGASLHPVQDFYSHSNWVELYPMQGGVYGTRTWFDTPAPSPLLRTGLVGPGNDMDPTRDSARDHGGYDAGMNHDSYSRPRWSEAYVYAYSGSRQWLRAIRQWVEQVDPAIWRELVALRLNSADATALTKDLRASYQVSLWVFDFKAKNGAWKGHGSGDATSFAYVGGKWAAAANSMIVQQFHRPAYDLLVRGMDQRGTSPGAPPPLPRFALERRAVEVRTLRAALRAGNPDNALNEADLYAQVAIGGQTFVEATRQDSDEIQPAWLSIAFVPDTATVIPVRYELFDEDGPGELPDTIDVGPGAGRAFATFDLTMRGRVLSGDLTGVHDAKPNAATLHGGGDSYPASVTLYVNVRELQPKAAP